MKDIIKKSIEINLPALVIGTTGVGKSSIIKQACAELGYDLVDLRGASIMPEDIGGLPRASVDGDSYDYLMPKWFKDRLGTKFVLFLDEINQSSVQVLHSLYSVVLDRMVAGRKNTEMRVIAAGNTLAENENLTMLMKPLMARFPIQIKYEPELKTALDYLKDKYPNASGLIDLIQKSNYKQISPREIEYGIQLLSGGLHDVDVLNNIFKEITYEVLSAFTFNQNPSETSREEAMNQAVKQIKAGSFIFGGVVVPVKVEDILSKFSPEEQETIKLMVGSNKF